MDAKTATNNIRAALAAWLQQNGLGGVLRQQRVDGARLLPEQPALRFTIQGPTNLTGGWVRLWDGESAWAADLLSPARTGLAAPCARVGGASTGARMFGPDWLKLGTVESIPAALERYYKPDRLRASESGQVEQLVEIVRNDLERDAGLTLLASRHESNTGRPLWLFVVGQGFEVYQSGK